MRNRTPGAREQEGGRSVCAPAGLRRGRLGADRVCSGGPAAAAARRRDAIWQQQFLGVGQSGISCHCDDAALLLAPHNPRNFWPPSCGCYHLPHRKRHNDGWGASSNQRSPVPLGLASVLGSGRRIVPYNLAQVCTALSEGL